MIREPQNPIEAFAGLRVIVLGEAMLDTYLHGRAERISREAPVPILSVTRRVDVAGGGANTALNLLALGAHPTLLTVVGADREGDILRDLLAGAQAPLDGLFQQAGRSTLSKQRLVADDQLLMRFDHGSTERLDTDAEGLLLQALDDQYQQCDAVVVSDYAYGILTPAILERLQWLRRQRPRLLAVDARHLRAYRCLEPDLVKPNVAEAMALLGQDDVQPARRVDWVMSHGEALSELTGGRVVAVTLDSDGAVILERNRPPHRVYTHPATHPHSAGAGDTFLAAMTLALAAGSDAATAAELACLAAGVAVAKADTSVCGVDELSAAMTSGTKFRRSPADLCEQVERRRRDGRRIILTAGCFDLIHRGHVAFLNQAKALGDVLVVALNSDQSVRRLKGPLRPINPFVDRAQVLTALSCVDFVVGFDGDSPDALICAVRPDVYAKGGNYNRDSLPECSTVESIGGRIEILPYLPDLSTSSVIDRIRSPHDSTAEAQPRAYPGGAESGSPTQPIHDRSASDWAGAR